MATQPESLLPNGNDAPKGLPPVTPPSGRFIIQLFLIVGLIAAAVVGLRLLFGWPAASALLTHEQYLQQLDSANLDVRWRGAHDLAQVLKRPESVALISNPTFALDLAERVRKGLNELEQAEQSAKKDLDQALAEIDRDQALSKEDKQKQSQGARDRAWQKLSAQRDFVLFLISCMGDFVLPVGVPVLSEVALNDSGPDEKALALRRRRAVLALANLGENLKRYDRLTKEQKLTTQQQSEILADLEKETRGRGQRREWAETTLNYLKNKTPLGVDKTLATCADPKGRGKDPFLRELVAYALNFWEGPLVEETLVRLARDNGEGKRIEVNDND
jgi:hypothetical protein